MAKKSTPPEPIKEQPIIKISLFPSGSVPALLIVLLIIASFFIGMLYTRVKSLEKGGTPVGNQVAADTAPNVPSAPQEAGDVPEITKEDYVRGNRNAEIALIEYSDLECPFCKSFHPTARQVLDTYKDQVMWVYRHYPLPFHANAQKEAEAAECAGELGGNNAFWKYVDAIYERTTSNGTGFALDKLVPLAQELGLNQTTFQTCLDSGKYAQKIKDQTDGGTKAGVSGTPGNILLNTKTGKTRLIPGALPFDQFKTSIDELLAS